YDKQNPEEPESAPNLVPAAGSLAEDDAIPPRLFRLVKVPVGAGNQVAGSDVLAARGDSDTHTHRNRERHVVERERSLFGHLADPLRDLGGNGFVGLREHGGELLAAVACEQLVLANHDFNPVARL